MDKPRVSVIMNGYNGEAFLRQAIDSVLAQSWQDWEIIFWDNQSTDGSAAIVQSYADPRIRYFYAPTHTLLYEARNYAIEKATGDVFAFLDVDDWWHPEKLAAQVALLRDPQVGFVCSNYWVVTPAGTRIAYRTPMPEGQVLESLLHRYRVALLTLMITREAFASLSEKFNPDYHIIGDFDLVIRLAAQWRMAAADQPLAYYRIHGNNETGRHQQRQLDELAGWIAHMGRAYPAISGCRYFGRVAQYRDYIDGIGATMRHEPARAQQAYRRLPWGRYKLRLLVARLLPTTLLQLLKN